jgi:hypothetical protein
MKYQMIHGLLSPILLKDIDLRAAHRNKRKVKFLKDPIADVVGCDTETRRGNIFALGINGHDFENIVRTPVFGQTVSMDRCFEALTDSRLENKLCVWYNIGYDFGCLLKHLPKKSLIELREVGQVEYNGLTIRYIEGKGCDLRIGKKTIKHRDVAGVFHTTLKKAMESWTDERKLDETVDVKRFDDIKYLQRHVTEILTYLRGDARGTRLLWTAFAQTAQPLGIPCANPWSSGSIAEGHALHRFSQPENCKPGFGPVDMQNASLQSYYGGRFEVMRRGTVKRVKMIDINSAYPAAHSEAIDPGSVTWNRCGKISPDKIIPQGVYSVTAETANGNVMPLPFRRRDSIIIFPRGVIRNWYMGVELLAGIETGLFQDVTVNTGFVPEITKKTLYPWRYLPDLYHWRKELQAKGDHAAQLAVKIVINALYGKTIQAVNRKSIRSLEGVSDATRNRLEALPSVGDNEAFEWFQELHFQNKWVVSEHVAGSLFSPYTASWITASTRAELLRRAHTVGFNNVILFATDSIATTSRNVGAIGDTLGEWSAENGGELFVVGSGVYEIRSRGKVVKSAFRGLPSAYFRSHSLRDEAEKTKGRTLKIAGWVKPLSLREAMARGVDLQHVGRFTAAEKMLSCDFDTKRIWDDQPTWRDLLESSWRSRPLDLQAV